MAFCARDDCPSVVITHIANQKLTLERPQKLHLPFGFGFLVCDKPAGIVFFFRPIERAFATVGIGWGDAQWSASIATASNKWRIAAI